MDQSRPGGTSRSKLAALPTSVRELDLGCIGFKLLQPEAPVKWSAEQVSTVEEEYRKFLALRLLHPDKVIVPDGQVDVFWHQHILDTQKYAEDCNAIFGSFMHHFPYFGLRGPEDAKDLATGFATTILLYKETFGDPPADSWRAAADCGRMGCAPGPYGK